MNRIKRHSIVYLAALTILVGFVAGAQGASGQVRINLLHVRAGIAFGLPLAIAQEQGFFTKRGLEVKLVFVPGPDVPHLTEENPFGYIGAPAVLLRAAGGTDLKILGSFHTGRVSGHLVARPEITAPRELRGKRIGVRALGAALWIHTVLALERLGLDPERDNISLLSIGDVPQIARALEAGTIDAAVLPPTRSRQLKAKGFSVLLDLHPANIYVPLNALAVTATYLQQSPEVVEKVVAALIESAAFGLSPVNKSIVLETIVKRFKVADAASAEEAYHGFLRAAVRKPYPSVERMRDIQRVMARHDARVLNVKIEDLIDDRFIRELDESGVIDRIYNSYRSGP